jgi:hypothetical protein
MRKKTNPREALIRNGRYLGEPSAFRIYSDTVICTRCGSQFDYGDHHEHKIDDCMPLKNWIVSIDWKSYGVNPVRNLTLELVARSRGLAKAAGYEKLMELYDQEQPEEVTAQAREARG